MKTLVVIFLSVLLTASIVYGVPDFVRTAPDSTGKRIDNESFLRAGDTIYRQRIRVGGINDQDLITPINIPPTGTEYGLPVWLMNPSGGGGGGGTEYDQGTVATATDKLTLSGAVRRDSAAVDAGVAAGDRVTLSTDSLGRLRTSAADQTQPMVRNMTIGTVTTLDSANEPTSVNMENQRTAIVIFTANTAFTGTVEPICAFDNVPTWVNSEDFKLIDRTDGSAGLSSANLVSAGVVGTFQIYCGARTPLHAGVRANPYTSGSVNAQVLGVPSGHIVTVLTPAGVSPWGTTGIKTEEQNKSESAGKSGPASVDSFTHCTGQFNELLDAVELVHLTPLPPTGQFARICWALAVIDAGATAAADFALWEGTTTTTPCDGGSPQVVMGPWSLEKTTIPGIPIGRPNGPILAITAGRRMCAKSTNATSVNKIRIVGTYATY